MTPEPEWRARRREKIVHAAAALFSRNAYALVQMDDIARRAEVGKPTLYRYFPSKEDLYLSVCEEAFQRLEVRLAAAAGAAPPAALRAMLEALVDMLGKQLASLDFLNAEEQSLNLQWRQLYSRRRRMIVDRLRAVLDAGVLAGTFAPGDTELAAQLLLGMVRGGLFATAGQPRDTLLATLVEFAEWGLAGRREPSMSAARPAPAVARTARARR